MNANNLEMKKCV